MSSVVIAVVSALFMLAAGGLAAENLIAQFQARTPKVRQLWVLVAWFAVSLVAFIASWF